MTNKTLSKNFYGLFYCLSIIFIINLTLSMKVAADQLLNSDTNKTQTDVTIEKTQIKKNTSILDKRKASDDIAIQNFFAMAQHQQNYLLPVTYATHPRGNNPQGLDNETVDNFEAKYQISVKLPIYLETNSTAGLYLGFTAMSYWQVYNSEVSKPFRETNYEPELYYSWHNDVSILGFNFNEIQLGVNHQSNGQSDIFSRSWNRLFASVLFSDESSYYYFKTWYRFKEDKKTSLTDTSGDDNPDITHFLGHIELGYAKQLGKFNLLTLVRNNLKINDNKGSVEFNLTYPISDRYDVLLQYFNGYGDSLIDYNHHQQRIGLGVQLKFL